MQDHLEDLATKITTPRSFDSPPLHLWHPNLLGDIPILINDQGEWYHDGDKIQRESLVRLFASILRKEEDGHYYLVTPTEKWRITVESHALLITDFDARQKNDVQVLEATLNTGKQIMVNEQNTLFLDTTSGEGIVALNLPHGLSAICTRPAWYRLVDMANPQDGFAVLRSGDYTFKLPSEDFAAD